MEEKSKKGSSIKHDQRRVMVQFLREHPSMYSNQLLGPHGDQTRSLLWNEVAERLNAMAGPSKEGEKWQKSFFDWRSSVKAKALALKKYRRGTGGGREPSRLTDLEEICVNEFLTKSATDGLTQVVDTLEVTPVVVPSPSSNALQQDDPDDPDDPEEAVPTVEVELDVFVQPSAFKKARLDPASERKRLRKCLLREERLDIERTLEKDSIDEHLKYAKESAETLKSVNENLTSINDSLKVLCESNSRMAASLASMADYFSKGVISFPLE